MCEIKQINPTPACKTKGLAKHSAPYNSHPAKTYNTYRMSPKQDRQKRDIHEIFIGLSPLRLLKFRKNLSIPIGIFFRKFKNLCPQRSRQSVATL